MWIRSPQQEHRKGANVVYACGREARKGGRRREVIALEEPEKSYGKK